MAETSDLLLRVRADASQAEREIRKMGPALGSVERQAASLQRQLVTFAAGFVSVQAAMNLLGRAVSSAIGFLRDATAGTAELADRLADDSGAIGMAAQSLQSLEHAAALAGVSAAKLMAGMQRFASVVSDARSGNEQAVATFARLGVTLTDATGQARGQEEVLRDVADALERLGPGAETTALAMDLFGRSGGRMVTALAEGRDSIDGARARLEEYGALLGGEALEQARRYETATAEMSAAVLGLKTSIGSDLLPGLIEWIGIGTDLVAMLTRWRDRLGDVVGWLMRLVPGVGIVLPLLDDLRRTYRALVGDAQAAVEEMPPDLPFRKWVPPADTSPRLWETGAAAREFAVDLGTLGDELFEFGERMGAFRDLTGPGLGAWLTEMSQEAGGATGVLEGVNAQLDAQEEAYRRAAEAAEEAARREQQAIASVGSAITTTAGSVEQFMDLFDEGGQTADKRIRTIVGAVVRLAGQLISSIASTTAASVGSAATTAAAQTSANSAIAVSGAVAGGAQATATFGASAGAGAAAFAAAIAAILGTVGTIAAAIRGVADAGLPPDALRRAGLNQHTMLAVRNDEMVLDPRGTREISGWLRESRQRDFRRASDSDRPINVRSEVAVLLDRAVLGRAIDEHLIRARERGRRWEDRLRPGFAGA